MISKKIGITMTEATESALLYICELTGLTKSQALALVTNTYAMNNGYTPNIKKGGNNNNTDANK